MLGIAFGFGAAAVLAATPAWSGASILIDADSGKVLRADNATYPWYPASTTKLMTLYMTLSAVRDNRITFDTLFTVSRNANLQAPTKMGLPVGTQVTVDNALKMMMVKSANDMAVLLAEGIGGSVDDFAQADDRHRAQARHVGIEFRQSERAAGRRPDHLGARSRHSRPRADPRISRLQFLLARSGDQIRASHRAQL